MATSKRRLMISMSGELDLAVERLAGAMGKPRATVISQLLEAVVPQLHSLASAIEKAGNDPASAMSALLGMTESNIEKSRLAEEDVQELQQWLASKPKPRSGS